MFKSELIKSLCKEKGLSLTSLADQIGISNQGMHSLLKNNSTTIATLEKICNILGVTPNYFFEDDKDSANSIHLNSGSGIAQYSAGDIRGNNKIVSDNGQYRKEINENIEIFNNRIDGLKELVKAKDEIIDMLKEQVEGLKRQIR
ncbi:MAG: helix-turn-helix transcriptional regulator [Bacteroidota bacterium]